MAQPFLDSPLIDTLVSQGVTARVSQAMRMNIFATCATARDLSEQQARQKAAAILKGDPYGQTAKFAGSRIQKAQLIHAGTTDCG